MRITGSTLKTLFTGYNASYQLGLGMADSQYLEVATEMPSTTRATEYGWLGKMPGMREWLGERVIQNIKDHSYTIKNRKFELTLAVDADDIEDDELGQYGPLFQQFGQSVAAHPNELVFDLLRRGFEEKCYDGQNFFDADHPVIAANGEVQPVSNMQAGNGRPWFLMDASRVLKPIIFQNRKKPDLVSLDDPTDANVFELDQFVYGTKARRNVGFGFWQFAYGSKAALNADNYKAARVALQEMKGDHGRPLGLKPTKLVVAPGDEQAALKILNNALAEGGATNEWAGTAKVCVVPWLA